MFENKKLRSIFTAGGDGPMFENKKSKSIFTAEAVLPLVVPVLGGIAPYFPPRGSILPRGWRKRTEGLPLF